MNYKMCRKLSEYSATMFVDDVAGRAVSTTIVHIAATLVTLG